MGSQECRAQHPSLLVHGNNQGSGNGLSLPFWLQLELPGYCVGAGRQTTQDCDLTNNHTVISLNHAVHSFFMHSTVYRVHS